MNYTELFYWLVVADNAKAMFITFICIFTAIAAFSTLCYLFFAHTENRGGQTDEDKVSQTIARKWMWWSYPFMIFFWSLYVFTPSKRDALLIVAGGQTLDFLANDKSAKALPAELTGFILTEVKNLAKEAAVDLNISSQKDKVLEKAKTMTAEQLLSEMKKDTTFAKIVLDK